MKKLFGSFNIKKLAVIIVAVVAVVIVGGGYLNQKGQDSDNTGNTIKKVVDSNLVIQTKSVTDKPSFYPVKIDGTDMEVIAVKASDGTIRTAFNTCQVCNNSGKGYYKVEGNQLVCQNCGNRFGMDDVEVIKGNCNPVPLTKEFKTVNEDTITVSKDILKQATALFQTWK